MGPERLELVLGVLGFLGSASRRFSEGKGEARRTHVGAEAGLCSPPHQPPTLVAHLQNQEAG